MFIRAFTAALVVTILASTGWSGSANATTVPAVQPDKGLVIFYRPKKTAGSAIRFNVNHPQGSMGSLNNGTMLYQYFEPGVLQFWSQVISQDGITLNIEAGKTYFVRGDVQMGVFAGRPKFTPVDEARGRTDVSKL